MQLALLLALPTFAVASLVPRQDYGSCTANGQAGKCISTSSCPWTKTAGLCPGPSDIQCCTYGSCTASGVSGMCVPSSSCSGTTYSGLCPGPTDIKCCTTSSGGGGGSCGTPTINDATVTLIKEFEGSSPTPYRDSAGLPTIGIGHLCQRSDCSEIPYPIPMTQANIINLLNSDLLIARQGITSQVKVTLNASQYGALVSWAFNVGTGDAGSKGSTLVRRLNAGEDKNRVAAEELPKWNKAGGSVSNGLVRRRAAEVKLFQTATSERGIPAPC